MGIWKNKSDDVKSWQTDWYGVMETKEKQKWYLRKKFDWGSIILSVGMTYTFL